MKIRGRTVENKQRRRAKGDGDEADVRVAVYEQLMGFNRMACLDCGVAGAAELSSMACFICSGQVLDRTGQGATIRVLERRQQERMTTRPDMFGKRSQSGDFKLERSWKTSERHPLGDAKTMCGRLRSVMVKVIMVYCFLLGNATICNCLQRSDWHPSG